MSHWSVDANIGCGLMQAMSEGDVSIRTLSRGRYKVVIRGVKGREQISVGHFRHVTGVVGQATSLDLATALCEATQQAKGITMAKAVRA